jgi:hypothetical protein
MAPALHPGQQFGDEKEDERADDRAPERAKAAEHDREQEEDRKVGGEIIRGDDRLLHGEECAGNARQCGRYHKGDKLRALRRGADRQRRRLHIADCDKDTAKSRIDDIAHDDKSDDRYKDDGVVKRPRAELVAKGRRRWHADDAGEAFCEPAPFNDHFLENEGEGERNKGKIPGVEPERGQRGQHTEPGGESHPHRGRRPEGPVMVNGEQCDRVGADGDKSRVAKRDLSSIAGQKIEADGGDGIDAELRRDEQRIGISADESGQRQRDCKCGGLKRKRSSGAQRHHQTVRAFGLPNKPWGRTSRTVRTTMKITAS